MSRWNAVSDRDYDESIGDRWNDHGSNQRPPALCVACQKRFSMLKAAEHRGITGHQIRYKGRIVDFGLPDAKVAR